MVSEKPGLATLTTLTAPSNFCEPGEYDLTPHQSPRTSVVIPSNWCLEDHGFNFHQGLRLDVFVPYYNESKCT